jgi:hypothetical protein
MHTCRALCDRNTHGLLSVRQRRGWGVTSLESRTLNDKINSKTVRVIVCCLPGYAQICNLPCSTLPHGIYGRTSALSKLSVFSRCDNNLLKRSMGWTTKIQFPQMHWDFFLFHHTQKIIISSEKGIVLAEATGLYLARGPDMGLVAQIMFGSGPSSGLVQMIGIKRYIEHFGLSRAILFFSKEKLFVIALIVSSWHSRAPERNPTDLIFSGIFVAASSQKQFEITPYKLGVRYIFTVPETPK